MGIKRVVEVLLHAPVDLTPAERMVLVAIGENVRDNDPRRETWADFNAHVLAERAGLTGTGSLKSALQRLAKRGLEVRIPITFGKDGRPLYALPGKQCRYRFPALEGEVTASPSEEEGEVLTSPGEVTASPKGRSQPRQARSGPPPTPPPYTPPPSKGAEEEEDPAAPSRFAGRKQQHDDALAAAASFLEALPDPWTIGPRTAVAMAPDLATAVARQGWDLDDELVRKLTEKPEGIKSYSSILRIRIGDLPRRIKRTPPRQPAPLPKWCGACADGSRAAARQGHLRLIYDDAGHARPCPKCHPSQTSHAA